MIISKTPLRISLGGGGTDIPSFYSQNEGGFLVSAAINKYIYVSIHENFINRFLLKYSTVEDIEKIDQISHPIIRETLRYLEIDQGVEITSLADIPAGTGLGSSGAFTVGLLKAVLSFQRKLVSRSEIAEMACKLEIEILGEPVGKQDQFATALGGITAFSFSSSGEVSSSALTMPPLTREEFEDNLLLFFTGIRRSASEELEAISSTNSISKKQISQNLLEVRDIGHSSYSALNQGRLEDFADLMNEQWNLKYKRSPSPVHDEIDYWIRCGIRHGALGGKLVGAGGGGFLLFYAEEKAGLRKIMGDLGLKEVKFSFDYEGTTLL